MKRSILLAVISLTGLLSPSLQAQTNSSPDSNVIVIQNPKELRSQDKTVFVESGTDVVQGSPEESVKAAYRKWDQACKTWKDEMQRRNGKNLILASCGVAKRSEEKHQSQKLFTYRSESHFKVRVSSDSRK